jgi:phosphate-starvation-inducible protein E
MTPQESVTLRTAKPNERARGGSREWIARGFSRFEDVVYIGLGVLLAVATLALLIEGAVTLTRGLVGPDLGGLVIALLDRSLLILMLVEILYTVQVSFREHALVPEPFLVVGLIAAIRRLLVLTAEFSRLLEEGEAAFRNAMIELGLLTLVVVALVASLLMLKHRGQRAIVEKA